jgi:hypothetical protein
VPPDVKGVTMRLTCSSGTISTAALASMTGEKLLNIGIINASTDDKTFCSNKAFEDPYNCRQYLSEDRIEGMLNRECKGKESCTLGNWDTDLYRKNLPRTSSTEFNECFGSGS